VNPQKRLFGALLTVVLLTAAASAQSTVDRVLVLKRQHRLLLMLGKRVVKSYKIALGRGGLKPKQREGDGRTPEGLYTIDYRNPASKYYLALHISYPRSSDKHRARIVGASPGGDIMIHGLPARYAWVGANHRIADWTNGCIAVTDAEMDEIWKLVPDGTTIEIRP
jgi:murein L,D-transpeptidase YafK